MADQNHEKNLSAFISRKRLSYFHFLSIVKIYCYSIAITIMVYSLPVSQFLAQWKFNKENWFLYILYDKYLLIFFFIAIGQCTTSSRNWYRESVLIWESLCRCNKKLMEWSWYSRMLWQTTGISVVRFY